MKLSILLLAIGLLLFCGCSNEQDKKIVGKWQEINNPKGALLFNSDHTGKAYWPDEAGVQQGSSMKWQLLEDGNQVSVITPPGPVNFIIKDERLLAPNGVVLTKVR